MRQDFGEGTWDGLRARIWGVARCWVMILWCSGVQDSLEGLNKFDRTDCAAVRPLRHLT